MLVRTIAALAVALSLAVVSPAAADSIAYVKDGNVWLSTSDGSRQYQVTSGGGYSDVSQADDGTMIALNGVRLHKLSRDGIVLADFDTPVSDTRPPGQKAFYGPLDPAISPDGSKLAYSFYYVSISQNPSCYPPTCYTSVTEGGTGYSWTDRQTAWDEPGLGKHTGWRNPSWLSDDTLMLSDPTHLPNRDVVFDTVGDTGVPLMDWFYDRTQGNTHVGGGDMTRQRDKMAFVVGDGDRGIRIYWVERWPTRFPPSVDEEYPLTCFQYGSGSGVSTPTWSPDGGRLAWANAEGIRTVSVPAFPGGCSPSAAQPTAPVLIPGGGQPDWGPADVPPARPARADPPAEPRSDPRPDPRPDPSTVPRQGERLCATSCANPQRPRALRAKIIAASIERGVTVRISAPSAGKLTATAHRRGRRIAASSTLVVRKQAATVRLRFAKAGRRVLERTSSAKVTIRVTFDPKRGATQRARLTATVR